MDSIPFSKGKHYPMNVDEVEETTWQVLSGRLEERDNSDTLVRISLEDGVNAVCILVNFFLSRGCVDNLVLTIFSLPII